MREPSLLTCSAAVACLLLSSLVAGCLIDRSDIHGMAGGMDASVPTPDVYVPIGEDAGPLPDAFVEGPDVNATPDATSFADCDERGEPCCSGTCGGGLTCTGAGICDVAGCGAAGTACCRSTPQCFGTTMCNGTTCEGCGGEGQLCCAVEPRCASGSTACNGSRCVSCGGRDQPCCGTTCLDASLSCNGGTCGPREGTPGGRCIDGVRCGDWAFCDVFSNTCNGCGRRGEVCCAVAVCMSGSTCRVAVCS